MTTEKNERERDELVFTRRPPRVPVKFFAEPETYKAFKSAVIENKLQVSDVLCELIEWFTRNAKAGRVVIK